MKPTLRGEFGMRAPSEGAIVPHKIIELRGETAPRAPGATGFQTVKPETRTL